MRADVVEIVTASCGALVAIWRMSPPGRAWAATVRRRHEIHERLAVMADDWAGRPARPGFPAVLSVPQRLEVVEHTVATLHRRIEEELPRNGRSARAVLDSLRGDVADAREEIASLRTDFETHAAGQRRRPALRRSEET